jgi:mannose-6-phosphate isomerase-like protein (cupin superfamily)
MVFDVCCHLIEKDNHPMLTPSFTPFDDCPSYEQDDAPGLSFRKVLAEGLIPDLDMGLVTAAGPTHKFPARHEWEQVYLIFRGTGYVYLDEKKLRIDRPGIVIIPKGTEHSIEADAGETMQYVYVNKRDSRLEIRK